MDGSDILHELDEVEFATKLRGYDPIEVDKMLERARREVADLRDRAQAADERARSAEEQLDVELEEVRQAHEAADTALAAARKEADRLVDSATTKAERLAAASELEIRETIESGRKELVEELLVLESQRDEIRGAMDLAECQMFAHRDRLLSAIEDLRNLIEGLTTTPGSGKFDRAAGSEPELLASSTDSPGELEEPDANAGGVVHRMTMPSAAVETEGSRDSADQVRALHRPIGGVDTDTAAVEAYFSEEGGSRSGAGHS